MRASSSVLLLLLLLPVVQACGPSLPAPDSVARIDERDIHYPAFERYLADNVGGETTLSSAVLSQLFDQFLDEELMLTRAVEEGLVEAEASRRQAVEALLNAHPRVQVSDQEVALYYREHAERFAHPERVRLRQILVEERERAQEAQRALAAGEDFAEVARRLSEEPGAPYGGEQGELSREDLPPRFVEVVFRLQEGEVSDIIPVEYGFHIFQVVERFPERTVPPAEAEAEIRDLLLRRRADQARADLLTEVRERYNVEVYERNLPFAYQGSYREATTPEPSES